MIIAEDNEVTLEVNGNEIIMHDNEDGLSIIDYQELRVTLTKDQIKSLIDELSKWH